ncbi:hypothetical protein BG452_40175 [Streptomyces sp. CBMA123]|nr:hypothetical protein [Streptomyces sp. CBMA123]
MQAVADDGDKVTELQGYPAPPGHGTFRLFLDLSLSRYLEIPLEAILASVEPEETAPGPTKVYVRSSAQLVAARRLTACEAAQATSPATSLLRSAQWHRVCDWSGCWVEPVFQ